MGDYSIDELRRRLRHIYQARVKEVEQELSDTRRDLAEAEQEAATLRAHMADAARPAEEWAESIRRHRDAICDALGVPEGVEEVEYAQRVAEIVDIVREYRDAPEQAGVRRHDVRVRLLAAVDALDALCAPVPEGRLREIEEACRACDFPSGPAQARAWLSELVAEVRRLSSDAPSQQAEPAPCPPPEEGQVWTWAGRVARVVGVDESRVTLEYQTDTPWLQTWDRRQWPLAVSSERLLSPSGEVLWTGPEWRRGGDDV